MRYAHATTLVLLMLADSAAAQAGELAPPVQIEAGRRPLDVERSGHSAPFLGDFDGDGLPDLLVGQYDEGKLRIYLNRGSNERPKFDDFEWFQAGGQAGRVPEG
jgi:hypothetical protein